MRFSALAFFVACTAAVSGMALAGYRFRQDTPVAVRSAVSTVHSAEYATRLAEIEPDRAKEDLSQALTWNPRSTTARIALALEEERAGDLEAAARDLNLAASADHQFLPAWALANFYFRHGERDPFWIWANRAARLNSGDLDPLLALCDELDPGNATSHLTPDPKLDRAYLDFLIRASRWADAVRVSRKLGTGDSARLAALTTKLIDAHQYGMATAVWTSIHRSSQMLFNGDLRAVPSDEGFDWRVAKAPGVNWNWREGELTFHFSGDEDEASPLMDHAVALAPGAYRLTFEYATTGFAAPAGVRWLLDNTETDPIEPSPEWRSADRSFVIRRGADPDSFHWLRLIYRRNPGSSRARGEFRIRNILLKGEPHAQFRQAAALPALRIGSSASIAPPRRD
jgi:hypothetical protein